jgi:hypothetical protein
VFHRNDSNRSAWFCAARSLERLPGAVIAIARKGKLVYYEAFGMLGDSAGTPMPRNAIFPNRVHDQGTDGSRRAADGRARATVAERANRRLFATTERQGGGDCEWH